MTICIITWQASSLKTQKSMHCHTYYYKYPFFKLVIGLETIPVQAKLLFSYELLLEELYRLSNKEQPEADTVKEAVSYITNYIEQTRDGQIALIIDYIASLLFPKFYTNNTDRNSLQYEIMRSLYDLLNNKLFELSLIITTHKKTFAQRCEVELQEKLPRLGDLKWEILLPIAQQILS